MTVKMACPSCGEQCIGWVDDGFVSLNEGIPCAECGTQLCEHCSTADCVDCDKTFCLECVTRIGSNARGGADYQCKACGIEAMRAEMVKRIEELPAADVARISPRVLEAIDSERQVAA